MKKYVAILVSALISYTSHGQFLLGSDISLAQPVGSMTRTMTNAFSIALNGSYKFKNAFSLGADFAAGTYGSQTTRQQYVFDNGDVTETDVVVSNNIYTMGVNGKYFFRSGKKISPYVSGRLGISWFVTDLNIEDPADQYSCHPLESDKLMKDHTVIAGVGGGVRIDLSSIFRNMDSDRFYIDTSIHSLQGGTIRYMNADLKIGNSTPDSDVMARFLNTQTQVIHEHHVGYVYSSIMNMLDYRIGVVVKPGWQN